MTTVDVTCPICETPRPIRYSTPIDLRRAADRQCLNCYRAGRYKGVDEVAVQRLLSGSRVQATRAERQAAVTYLVDRRVPNSVIAARIHASQRTVERLRQRMRQETA